MGVKYYVNYLTYVLCNIIYENRDNTSRSLLHKLNEVISIIAIIIIKILEKYRIGVMFLILFLLFALIVCITRKNRVKND